MSTCGSSIPQMLFPICYGPARNRGWILQKSHAPDHRLSRIQKKEEHKRKYLLAVNKDHWMMSQALARLAAWQPRIMPGRYSTRMSEFSERQQWWTNEPSSVPRDSVQHERCGWRPRHFACVQMIEMEVGNC